RLRSSTVCIVDNEHAQSAETARHGLMTWDASATALPALSADVLFGVWTTFPEVRAYGYGTMQRALAVAWSRNREFARDLSIIAASLGLISAISVEADISWTNIVRMGLVLSAVVIGPWLVTRYVFADRTIVFPRRHGRPWSRLEWGWLA